MKQCRLGKDYKNILSNEFLIDELKEIHKNKGVIEQGHLVALNNRGMSFVALSDLLKETDA